MAADNIFLMIFILRMRVEKNEVVYEIAKKKTMEFRIYSIVYICIIENNFRGILTSTRSECLSQ
jgi:hypothetical protein